MQTETHIYAHKASHFPHPTPHKQTLLQHYTATQETETEENNNTKKTILDVGCWQGLGVFMRAINKLKKVERERERERERECVLQPRGPLPYDLGGHNVLQDGTSTTFASPRDQLTSNGGALFRKAIKLNGGACVRRNGLGVLWFPQVLVQYLVTCCNKTLIVNVNLWPHFQSPLSLLFPLLFFLLSSCAVRVSHFVLGCI